MISELATKEVTKKLFFLCSEAFGMGFSILQMRIEAYKDGISFPKSQN